MRVTLERSQLLKSLSHISRVVEKRSTEQVLSNVLLETLNSDLCLKATDLDMEITETVSAMVEQPGKTTVSAHLLYDIVRKIPDGAQLCMTLEDEGKFLSIVSGNSNFRLACLSAEHFPASRMDNFSHSFVLKAGDFLRLVKRTLFAISTEETRYYLTGVYLHVCDVEGQKFLRAVSTDGHRLAHIQCIAPEGVDEMPGALIPRKVLTELDRVLSEDEQLDLNIDLSEASIRFSLGDLVITSKLIDGTFPDYQCVIPFQNDKELRVNCAALTAAVDRVSTVLSDRGRAMKLTAQAGQLFLNVSSSQTGSAEDCLDASYAGEVFNIGFNARYVGDIMAQMIGEEVIFKFSDMDSPALIEDSGASDALYVLMPMRY